MAMITFSPLVDVSLEKGSVSNMVLTHSWYSLVISLERSGPCFIKVKIFLKSGFKMNWSSYVLVNSLNLEFL